MEAIFVGTLDGIFKVTRSSAHDWRVAGQQLAGLEVSVLANHPRGTNKADIASVAMAGDDAG